MKAFLISLLVLTGSIVNAQSIWAGGPSAPIFAKLQLAGISRNMTTINPRFKNVTAASVTFNNKTLTLTLNKSMPKCAAGMMCIQVMPAPLQIQLNVIKTEKTECATVYTAATSEGLNSNLSEVVTVEDYTYSNCPVTVESVGLITYQVTGMSSLTKQVETASANLLVVGPFVRAAN